MTSPVEIVATVDGRKPLIVDGVNAPVSRATAKSLKKFPRVVEPR